MLLLEAGGSDNYDLDPHPGRLPVLHRQSAHRLAVQDRAGAGPQRPQPALSARQGAGRLLVDQRHDLHARPGARLRRLAPAGPSRLGLGRVLPYFKQARGPVSSSDRATPSRAPAANGGSRSSACAGTSSTPSRRGGRAGRHSQAIDDFNRGDNEGVGYFEVNQTRGVRWNAAKASCAGARAAQPAGWNRRAGRARACSTANAPPAWRCGKTAQASRTATLPRRGHSRRRRDRLAADPAAVGHRPRRCLRQHGIAVRHDAARRRREPAGPPADPRGLQGRTASRRSTSAYQSLLGQRRIGLEYALQRSGPMSMAPSQLGAFTRSDPSRDARQPAVPRAAAVARRASASRCMRSRRSRRACATCNPTSRGHVRIALARSGRRAAHRAELPLDRRRPPQSPPSPARHARHRRAAGAGAVPAGGIQAGLAVRDRRRAGREPPATSARPSSIRSAPPRWAARRPDGGGRRAPARARRASACASSTPASCRPSPAATPTRRR